MNLEKLTQYQGIPVLKQGADLMAIADYICWLHYSVYNYHLDDDPEDIEGYSPMEQKVLRWNADIMWGQAAKLTENASEFIWGIVAREDQHQMVMSVQVGDMIWGYHCEVGEQQFKVITIEDDLFYCEDVNGNTFDIYHDDVVEIHQTR